MINILNSQIITVPVQIGDGIHLTDKKYDYNYANPSSADTLLVVAISSVVGFVPTVSFNGTNLINQVAITGARGQMQSAILTLISPANVFGILRFDFGPTYFSTQQLNVTIYTFSTVYQANPLVTTYTQNFTLGGNGAWSNEIDMDPQNSVPGMIVDVLAGNPSSIPFLPNGSQIIAGNSSYFYNTLFATSISKWTSADTGWGSSSGPDTAHSLIYIREDKSFTANDTIMFGESVFSAKGHLAKVIDSIALSEIYSGIRKVFFSISDIINPKDRGFFGSIDLFTNMKKSITNWINQNKS